MSKNAPKVHEWEGSKSGIRKHYRKILYPTAGVALVGTTTAAVVLPIMIKKMAEDKFAKILPIGGPVNSLRESKYVQERGVNYLAIGDSVTAGYNGYMSSNDVVQDNVLANPMRPTNPNVPGDTAEKSNVVALKAEIAEIDKILPTLTGDAKIQKEQVRKILVSQLADYADHTTKDYLSYADFVASDLQKAGKLHDYRNFALTGATIPNLRQTILRNPTALACLQDADLISLSIGANDLLAAVEVLRLSFNGLRGESDTEKVAQYNVARDAIDRITKINTEAREQDDFDLNANGELNNPATSNGYRAASASAFASEYDTKNLIKKSFNKLVNMLQSGSLGGLLDVQQSLLDSIFDLIKLDTATAIKEINGAAPQAKIVLMGYAFPFHLLPESIIDAPIYQYVETKISSERTPRTYEGGQATIRKVFMNLIDSLKATVERANYVKFFDINELKEFRKESDNVAYSLDSKDETSATSSVTRPEWDRVMPNPLDIHPSTYGHQVIAGHLYEWISRDLGLKTPDYQSIQKLDPVADASTITELEKIYTYAHKAYETNIDPSDSGFIIHDEKEDYDSASLISALGKLNNPDTLKSAGDYIKDYIDPVKVADNYQDVMDIFKDSTLTTGQKVDRALEVVKKLIVDEHKALISGVIDLVKGLVDTDKLIDNIGDIISSVSDKNLSSSEKITKVADLMKLSVKDIKFGNVAGYKVVDFVENIKQILLTCDFENMPDDASATDIILNLAAKVYSKQKDANGEVIWFDKTTGEAMTNVFFTQSMINSFPGLTDQERKDIKPNQWYPQDKNGKVYWLKNIDGLVTKYETTPTYDIHGIKLVEGVLGMLIYISADANHFGALDRTSDTFYSTFKPTLVSVLNSLSSVMGKGSVAETLNFALFSPLIEVNNAFLQDGKTPVVTESGDNLDRFKTEMLAATKELGMDLTSIAGGIDLFNILADTALTDALKQIGIK